MQTLPYFFVHTEPMIYWRYLVCIYERMLSLFEGKVLRCIFGAKLKNGVWRKRYNRELCDTFNESYIVNCIKVKRLAWAGHVVRINSDRTLKKTFSTKLERVRTVGRPKLRWEDGVNVDMKTLEVKNWKTAALDRDEWIQLLIKKARAHQGLWSQ